MAKEEIRHEELTLSDRLSIERTLMAAETTLLAIVRTSLSLIGFGFTIFKVLDAINKVEGIRVVREQTQGTSESF